MNSQELKKNKNSHEISPESPHRKRRQSTIQAPSELEQTFSQWEVMFLFKIVNSTHMKNGRECRTYYCPREELVSLTNEETFKQLQLRGLVTEWRHESGWPAVTLTPWGACFLGVRLSEYWVRYVSRVQEYRGLRRRPAWVRIQRWDTEVYWTYRNRPEKSIRIPGNTCELPLLGDPEDKKTGQDYLEDWHTWLFAKDPKQAIKITIRVGSFAHDILVQRDKQRSRSRKKKGRKS